MKKIYAFALLLFLGSSSLLAQENHSSGGDDRVNETFLSYMGVNLQTVMHPGKKTLSYRISHRLGDFSSGALNGFGLDGPASIYIGFDYGLKDNLTLTLGRNSLGKVVEGAVKWTPLRQSGSMPISLGVFGKSNLTYAKDEAAVINGYDRYANFSHRMSYVTQVMVARKLNDRVSLQISPMWVHQNLVETRADGNDIFTVAASAEYRFSKKSSISGEYAYNINKFYADGTEAQHRHSCGLSYNIRTGGHIFSIVLVNSFGLNEAYAIPYTSQHWLDGDFRIGFNIMRSFWL
jgi:hypothetical protein